MVDAGSVRGNDGGRVPVMNPDQTGESSTEQAAEAERKQRKLESILRRVDAGDTSVVSEVYWLQMFGEDAGLK